MDPARSAATLEKLQSNWTWIPDWTDAPLEDEAARLVTFRREIDLSDLPSEALVRLSADTRYKLMVNGQRVAVGPTRGSDRLWYYDTVDVTPFLQPGRNIVDVKVLRFFPGVNAGIPFARTAAPGLTVSGRIGPYDISTTKEDMSWRAWVEGNVYYASKSPMDIFLHVFEHVKPSAGERTWRPLQHHQLVGHYGILPPWQLAPRMIPLPVESPCTLASIRHCGSDQPLAEWDAFLRLGKAIDLAPGTVHRLELEFDVHSTAFVKLRFKRPRGQGSTMTITYSEAYEVVPRQHPLALTKTDRTKREGHGLTGPMDMYAFPTLASDESENVEDCYEPFWWRTFRFIVLEVQVGPDPLTLLSFNTVQTNYPLDVVATWDEPGRPETKAMWDVSLRTLRNCMFDGYSDCPFYEQLQYCEDTRSSILFHYLTCGDDRLARQAITAYAASIQPDGLVTGRYPAHGTQIITGFALFWVLQVCDHMQYFNDPAFARQFLPTIDAVLGYFARKVDPDTGLVSDLPKHYWSFIDWDESWNEGDEAFKDPGVPPSGRKDGTWTFFTMLYAYTLRRASTLLTQVGRHGNVPEYVQSAAGVSRAVRQHCFDGKLFTDTVCTTSSVQAYSQHCQVWAVLSEAIDPSETGLGLSVLSHAFQNKPGLAICSYPMMHYAFRALSQVGHGLYEQLYHDLWDPWRAMLAKNLSTWEEDSVNGRSDCHAWSSLPLYEFTTEVAGLTPAAPGWETVSFCPRLGLAEEVTVKVAIGRHGAAEVSWKKREDGRKVVNLGLPQPLRVISRMPGGGRVDHGVVSSVEALVPPS